MIRSVIVELDKTQTTHYITVSKGLETKFFIDPDVSFS